MQRILFLIFILACSLSTSLAVAGNGQQEMQSVRIGELEDLSVTELRCLTAYFNFSDNPISYEITDISDEDKAKVKQQLDELIRFDSSTGIVFAVNSNGRIEETFLTKVNNDSVLNIEFPVAKVSSVPLKSSWGFQPVWKKYIEQMPQFTGGVRAINEFFLAMCKDVGVNNKHIKKGFSYLFHVNLRGIIDEVIVYKSISKKLDNKIVQRIKEMSKWTPPRINAMPGDIWFNFDSNYYINILKEH